MEATLTDATRAFASSNHAVLSVQICYYYYYYYYRWL